MLFLPPDDGHAGQTEVDRSHRVSHSPGMQLAKMKEDNAFALLKLTFADLRTIKDACRLYGKQGSAQGTRLAEQIDEQMEQIAI